ncbi:hypothetical protein [Mycolicibacterium hodleri]|uniref:hypothetical protein n=1 Tax=Mycolicibacterium hodleri TaxID=49897 RepID=UPI00112D4FA9|nr:hypothetical protein [Mycolicibacterium hodleri]
MALDLVIAYTVLVFVVALAIFLLSPRLGEERRPTAERAGLSLAAGVVWPVILLGVVELSSFAIYAKAHEHDEDDERIEVLV